MVTVGARRRAGGDLHRPDHRRGAGARRRRRPSIVEAADVDEWLDPDTAEDRLLALARRSTEGPFDCWTVSKRVNSPRNDDPDLLRPLDAETGR